MAAPDLWGFQKPRRSLLKSKTLFYSQFPEKPSRSEKDLKGWQQPDLWGFQKPRRSLLKSKTLF
ncbi:hypothetical protein A33Q_2335 [Indibacter alkaliphilus LW1]|uniref:Uncharacterized protein n=1 Tax=Indibacter alkaliphilus (strain CCUG 57479 / KCTC 22604 / LW1) TaxID=1189612 RepID=S2DHI2_INDAL|nr:hypothetical protein A33Q_2335 [Indibacter alkaliphilus LW1]